ncbi:unnamed protein product [Allacma fusca]|uniref:ABC-type glutathione-S-conjugate transporter n=1 Tax=Allacma fusca TaxID=39272 RepID=A0A8J2KG97_9HEXA|nr:unnamed protein product [Allacma fusca]
MEEPLSDSGMESFCGSKFWDLNTTWYTETPDLTPCFQKTVLVGIPCSFLWFCGGFEICRRNVVREAIPNSVINISTRILTTVLVILSLVRFVCSFIKFNPEIEVYPVDQVSPALETVTYSLALLLEVYKKQRGVANSAVLFTFWFLSLFCKVFEFQSAIRRLPLDDGNYQEICSFVVLMISYPLVVISFIFNCFSDAAPQQPTNGDGNGDVAQKQSPQSRASSLSKIFIQWIWPLVYLGYKRPLEASDLWALNREDQAHETVELFSKYWLPEFEKCQQRNKLLQASSDSEVAGDEQVLIVPDKKTSEATASILPALWRAYSPEFLWGCFLLLISRLILFTTPQILNLLINHVNSDEEAWKGYFYSVLMLIANTTQIFLYEHQFLIMTLVGMRTRNALCSAVYRKSLVISSAARKEATAGEIVNLMSVDSQRFLDIMMYVTSVWSAPLDIGLTLYFLWQLLGPSALAGLAIMVLMVPVTAVVTSLREKLQTKQMEAKDERVKLVNEVLSGIKVLKFYAWETSFEEEIKKIRQKEIDVLKKGSYLDSFNEFVWYTAPFLVAFGTFGTYVLIDPKNILDARKAFVAINLFNIVRTPMYILPIVIAKFVQAKVSMVRLNKFLNAEEIDRRAITHFSMNNGAAISIEDGVFCWEDNPTLRNINVEIKQGSLVAVVGVVGSGKSSLLSAILGELQMQSGTVNTSGSIAYVAQQAWIQNDTLKGNILFGQNFSSVFYNSVIKACALEPDLEILPGGDNTEIGEKGINLSGGQKQRVALARAVYNDADLYLLDDPLSAVDSHVGKHLFDQVIGPNGILYNKTRVLVTHGLTYLPQVDCILVMKNGEISEVGTFAELLQKKGDFAEFLTEHLSPEDLEAADNALVSQIATVEGLKEKVNRLRLISQSSEGHDVTVNDAASIEKHTHDTKSSDTAAPASGNDRLIEEEKTEVGVVKFPVILYYVRHIGWDYAIFTFVFHFLQHGLTLITNIWLSIWSMEPPDDGKQDIAKRNLFLGVYGGLGMSQSVVVFLATASMILGSLKAAKLLHNNMLRRILRAPMSFFETTPLGRILNRFSKDVDVADEVFPLGLRIFLTALLEVFISFVAIIYSTPLFSTVTFPILIVYIFIQRFYVASSRQLKRLESVSRSPIYSHFSETLTGATTIRAFRVENRFITESERTIDLNLMSYQPSIVSNRWMSICLEILGNLRIKEYGEVAQEAPWDLPEKKPASDWPQYGEINFNNFETRYREGLDLVLKGVTCHIQPGEKVGIVGRTGAVKDFSAGLEHVISEGGENLSVGERQLICLARALLRKTKILVLDEATAAVDLGTDDLIQKTIGREFRDCTVLTIAHRLNTIMDYDRVMVLDKGEIREFDSPSVLLQDSAFWPGNWELVLGNIMAGAQLWGMLILLDVLAAATTNLFDGGKLPDSVAEILKGIYISSNNSAPLNNDQDVSVSGTHFSQELNQQLPLKPLTPIKMAILTELKAIWDFHATAQDSLYKKQFETVLGIVFKFVFSREPSEPDETLDRIYSVLKELRKRIEVLNSPQLTLDQILELPLKPTHEASEERLNEKQVVSIFTTLKSVIADHYTRQLGQGIGEAESVPMSEHDNLMSSDYQNLILRKLYDHYGLESDHSDRDVMSNDNRMEKIASVRDKISPILPSNQRQTTQNAFLYPETTKSSLMTPQTNTLLHTSLKLPAVISGNSQDSYLNHKIGMTNLDDDSLTQNSVEQLANSIAQILYPLQSNQYPTNVHYHPPPEFGIPMDQDTFNEQFTSPEETWRPNTDQLSTTDKTLEDSYIPVQLLTTFDPPEDTTIKQNPNAPSYEFLNYNDDMTENVFLNSEFVNQALQNVYLKNRPKRPVLKPDIVRISDPTESMSSDPTELSVAQLENDQAETALESASVPLQIQVVQTQENPLVQVSNNAYNGIANRILNFFATLSALSFATKLVMFMGILIGVVSVMLSVFGSGSPVLAVGILGFMIPISILIFSPGNKRGKSNSLSKKQLKENYIVPLDEEILEILKRARIKYYDARQISK